MPQIQETCYISPKIVFLAVQLGVPDVTLVVQHYMTAVTAQTLLVPACFTNSHVVSIVNFLATAFTELKILLALDCGSYF